MNKILSVIKLFVLYFFTIICAWLVGLLVIFALLGVISNYLDVSKIWAYFLLLYPLLILVAANAYVVKTYKDKIYEGVLFSILFSFITILALLKIFGLIGPRGVSSGGAMTGDPLAAVLGDMNALLLLLGSVLVIAILGAVAYVGYNKLKKSKKS